MITFIIVNPKDAPHKKYYINPYYIAAIKPTVGGSIILLSCGRTEIVSNSWEELLEENLESKYDTNKEDLEYSDNEPDVNDGEDYSQYKKGLN